MSYKVVYLNDAKLDLNEASRWYKSKKQGLDERFIQSVKNELSRIIENPLIFSERFANIRIAPTKVFPYGIYFYIDDTNKQIVIIAVFHNKRNFKTIIKRV